MRIPIAYCLGWPDRLQTQAERLDFTRLGGLTFQAPDYEQFPCLRLAREALEQGGAYPAVLNAANEIAVEAFLSEKIKFTDIAVVVETILTKIDMKAPQSLKNVFRN